MGQKILMIDDRSENLMALEVVLDDGERELFQALSGNDGLKMLTKNTVDVVILDVNMPEMDGYETAELMRMNPKTQTIPIIFVTADDDDKRKNFQGEDLGGVDYVNKPVDADKLIETINRLT